MNFGDPNSANAVIIEVRSDVTMVGFAGDDVPRATFPSAVGGQQSPVERGVVVNWDAFAGLLRYALQDVLSVVPEETPVLLVEYPLTSLAALQRSAEIMFNNLSVPAWCSASRTALDLYATGARSGLVLHLEQDVGWAVPIDVDTEERFAAELLDDMAEPEKVATTIQKSIAKSMVDRGVLYGQIVVAGDVAGAWIDQLRSALQALAPTGMAIKISEPPPRKLSSWVGASIYASMGSSLVWIVKDEYIEVGPDLISARY